MISHRPRLDLFWWPLVAVLLVSLVGKALVLLRHSRAAVPVKAPGDVRVDPLSGRLEVRA